MNDIIDLSEEQAVALLELLPRIRQDAGLFSGLHLYQRSGDGALRVASDGWPGEYVVFGPSGTVEEPDA